jgi:hypothetical protein
MRAVFVAAGLVLLAGALAAVPDGAGSESPAPVHPVVVELFTAQGCSSCPPADRLLTELGGSGGGEIIPLAFHVDYWNHDGWTDPFSSADWTRRQVSYAKKLGLQQIYTPQAVVDGSVELIGSRGPELRSAVAAAAAKPAATIALKLEPSESKVLVKADAELPEDLKSGSWVLMFAVYETGLVTPVKSGENGGKTLQNDYVVRSLKSGDRVKATSSQTATLSLDKGWSRERLGVAVFLQDPSTLEIRGANARALNAP